MEEIWRSIIGYEDTYEISNNKKIRNKQTLKELSQFKRVENGSLYVGLTRNHKTKSIRIDRLYEQVFPNDNADNINEIWKDIKDYEGYYQVSNLGRIRSLDRYIEQSRADGTIYQRFMKGKILSLNKTNGRGYHIASLGKGCEEYRQNYYIHRLVADAFLPNPNNLPEVNHKDEHGDKSNNSVDNLEWVTSIENKEHAKNNYLNAIGIRSGTSKLTENEVMNIYNSTKSSKELSMQYNVGTGCINSIKAKRSWKHIHDIEHQELIQYNLHR